jgi:hypothetical protein
VNLPTPQVAEAWATTGATLLHTYRLSNRTSCRSTTGLGHCRCYTQCYAGIHRRAPRYTPRHSVADQHLLNSPLTSRQRHGSRISRLARITFLDHAGAGRCLATSSLRRRCGNRISGSASAFEHRYQFPAEPPQHFQRVRFTAWAERIKKISQLLRRQPF